MNLPPDLAEISRLLAQEPANRQLAAQLIQQLERQGLSINLCLSVGPKEKITPELAELIQTHRDALSSVINAPFTEQADSHRYFAEKQRALDMRRQGKAHCHSCIFL